MLDLLVSFSLGVFVYHCGTTSHYTVEVFVALLTLLVILYFIRRQQPSSKQMESDKKIDGDYWIRELNLSHHPEGGSYKEFYKNMKHIDHLPATYGDHAVRSFGTHIYFLLKANETAQFHRLKSDEIWNLVDGGPVTIFIINKHTGQLEKHHLGKYEKLRFSTIVPAESFYAIRLKDPSSNGYALVTNTVCPGFEYDDFELSTRDQLLKLYPQHKEVILDMTPT